MTKLNKIFYNFISLESNETKQNENEITIYAKINDFDGLKKSGHY